MQSPVFRYFRSYRASQDAGCTGSREGERESQLPASLVRTGIHFTFSADTMRLAGMWMITLDKRMRTGNKCVLDFRGGWLLAGNDDAAANAHMI